MRRVLSQPVRKVQYEQSDCGKEEICSSVDRVSESNQETECSHQYHHRPSRQFRSMNRNTPRLLFTRSVVKADEKPTWKRHELWIQEQKMRAAGLERQLKALQDRIDKQMSHFRAQYTRPMFPTRLKDVAQLLMPNSAPALELATLSWLGDWRPSVILGLLCSLAHSSSSLALETAGIERALSELIHNVRIEEAVIDEEMTEIQANCILHLPFSPVEAHPRRTALACVHSEFQKVHRVIVKAQNLRIKTLEMVVKRVLRQTDAAEFLVAFAGIQDAIYELSMEYMLRKGSVCVPLVSSPEQVEFERRSSKKWKERRMLFV